MIKVKNWMFRIRELNSIRKENEYGGKPGAFLIISKKFGMPYHDAICFDGVDERDKDFDRLYAEMSKKEKELS